MEVRKKLANLKLVVIYISKPDSFGCCDVFFIMKLFPGDAYMQLYGQVSKVLDQHLNNQVAKELLEDFPISTKSDLILEGAQVYTSFSLV